MGQVRKYLTVEEDVTSGGEMSSWWEKDGLEVLFYPNLDHAMVFDTKERRNPVLNIVHRFLELQ